MARQKFFFGPFLKTFAHHCLIQCTLDYQWQWLGEACTDNWETQRP